MRLASISNQLIIIALVLVGLYVGKSLIIPFVVAVVVWYLLNSLANLVGRIRFRKKEMPRVLQLAIAFILFIGLTTFLTQLVISNFEVFTTQYPRYHNNFVRLTSQLGSSFDLNFLDVDYTSSFDLPGLLAGAIDSSLGFVSSFFLVLLYVVFLLLEQQIFEVKLKLIFKDRGEYVRFFSIVRQVDESIHSYVSVKTSLCLLAGILSYLVMLFIGVDFAVLWALLIFLFNFIPIIGAFIGVILPSMIALLQFGSYLEPVLVFSLLLGIELVIGNFVEPKVLGTKLNLSPLVVILSLTFWGALWGVAGMFLCVPITVILMIILSQFEKTRNIAILLSGGKSGLNQ
ncbi:MAG: AI-2E family transporter [Bacteroidetes bacterium]|nr:AI-2E family transporter [Bacteroidota bacterium]